MAPRRVLVGPLPPLLSDLVQQLLAGTFEVTLSAATDAEGLVAAAAAADASVIVADLSAEVVSQALSQLAGRQLKGVAVVVLDAQGRSATRYVDGVALTVADLSPSVLREIIESA